MDIGSLYQFPSEPRKSASMRIRPEKGKENSKEIELFPSKSKRLLKALLSRRKSKKDEMLYTYLDEYWWEQNEQKSEKKQQPKTGM